MPESAEISPLPAERPASKSRRNRHIAILDLGIGVHVAKINSEAIGTGGELSATLDFAASYLNRLKLMIRSVNCEGGYVPSWFDAVYPVQRWGPQGQPFLALNPVDGILRDRNMLSYEISYDLGETFSITGGLDRFSDDSMRRARFRAKFGEENGRGLEMSMWSRADGPDIRLFSEEANLYSRARALYNILPHLLLNISFDHSWAFSDDDAAFLPLNKILVGVVYDISL